MPEPTYRIAKQFRRIEAVGMRGTNHGEYANPIDLQVYVTKGTDLKAVVDRVKMSDRSPRLRFLRLGHWMFQLDPALLQNNEVYTVHWKYQMLPGVDNYSRDTFVWNELPQQPFDEDGCVIYGKLSDALGMPLPNQIIVLEEYGDYASLTDRSSVMEFASDIFGLWSAELKKGGIYRFVFNAESKTVQLPLGKARVDIDELPSFQARDIVSKDAFGYPHPTANLAELLARQLTNAQMLAVMASSSIVKFISNNTEGGNVPAGNVEVLTHVQTAPSALWTITHNRNCHPVISVIDENDLLIMPDVSYPDRNTVVLSFGQPNSGRAILVCAPGGETPV